MTDAGDGKPQAGNRAPPDPVTAKGIGTLGIALLLFVLLTFYGLIATWPVPMQKPEDGFAGFGFLFWGPFKPAPDIRLFITVLAAGALGSLIHSLTSFSDYVGNRLLGRSWIWWLLLRAPIGAALALLFYLVLRGGLIVPALPNGGSTANTSQLLNPYGVAAISAMAGMFSRQATDKLRELFDTLFRTREPVDRADPLSEKVPTIMSTEPAKLVMGVETKSLSVTGRSFQPNCSATINGETREVERVNDVLVKVKLKPEDWAKEGKLQLVVENPAPDGGPSSPFAIDVTRP